MACIAEIFHFSAKARGFTVARAAGEPMMCEKFSQHRDIAQVSHRLFMERG
jgi:hypothetical protein